MWFFLLFQFYVIRERRKQDAIIINSGLNWTFIRPRYISEKGLADNNIFFVPLKKISSKISKQTLDQEIIEQFENPTNYIHKHIYV